MLLYEEVTTEVAMVEALDEVLPEECPKVFRSDTFPPKIEGI